jgi:hypothetical protein
VVQRLALAKQVELLQRCIEEKLDLHSDYIFGDKILKYIQKHRLSF